LSKIVAIRPGIEQDISSVLEAFDCDILCELGKVRIEEDNNIVFGFYS
jgi:hypothetical protein